MKNLFVDLLSDDVGNVSSVRAVMLLSFALILSGWLAVTIMKGQLQELPQSAIWVLAATLAGKVVQKSAEAKAPQTPGGAPAPAPQTVGQ